MSSDKIILDLRRIDWHAVQCARDVLYLPIDDPDVTFERELRSRCGFHQRGGGMMGNKKMVATSLDQKGHDFPPSDFNNSFNGVKLIFHLIRKGQPI